MDRQISEARRRCFAGGAGSEAADRARAAAPRVLDVVGSRLRRPYHFRARIQSFQAVAAPFPGRRGTGAASAGARRPRGELLSAFSEFSRLCEAENFPSRSSATNSPIADEARRRRFASRGRRLSDGTCGNARPWRFPGVTKGIRTTYHDFASQKGKIRKSRRRAISPRRIATEKGGGISIQDADIAFAYIISYTLPICNNGSLADIGVRRKESVAWPSQPLLLSVDSRRVNSNALEDHQSTPRYL